MKPFKGFKQLYNKALHRSTDHHSDSGKKAENGVITNLPTSDTPQADVPRVNAAGVDGLIKVLLDRIFAPDTPHTWALIGRPKVTFYENASNIVVNNPIMAENISMTQVQTNMNVLKEMLEHVIPGAGYDSSVRDSPPRCHPGTRTQILQDIQTRIHDPGIATRIVWIRGPAGVGKSAIMQTLAEAESSRRAIFTTLFFSRPNERDDPKKLFTTLAYGLAVLNLEYRRYIGDKLLDDPMFPMKSMDEQFQRLFVTPFVGKHVNFGSQRWIVFVDGLDECRGEREQCRVVDLIRDSVLRHGASTPFIWVIASRPEAHLKMSFTKAKADIGGGFWELEVPIDSDRSSQDVQRYLHAQFLEIGEMYADSVPPLWPSETDFLTLARASSGLFIFASTLVGYLLGGDPVFRLKQVVALIESSDAQTAGPPGRNPFKVLDLLYTQIMSDIPKEVLSITTHLLGFYLLEATLKLSPSPVPLLIASNILGLEQHTTYAALRKLHSVLACPLPDEADQQPIRFLHASFSDFITNSFRSRVYHIDQNREVAYVWQCCVRYLRLFAVNFDYNDIALLWAPSDAPQLNELCQARLLVYVQYWWQKTLVKFCGDPSQQSPPIRLSVDHVSLTKIFQDLGPSIFFGVENQGYPMNQFFTWLDDDAPFNFRTDFVVEKFPLYKLDVDRLFRSLCAQQWCIAWRGSGDYFTFDNIHLAAIKGFGVSEWAKGKETLWNQNSILRELVEAKTAVVRVFGLEPSKLCILVGPVSNRVKTAYYVLPYACELAWPS